MKDILEFQGEYRFLSNFYPCRLTVDGIAYFTAEAAYQAQKCDSMAERIELFASVLQPAAAKKQGRIIKPRPDWDEIKLDQMKRVLFAKFSQNPYLKRALLATGDALLEEGNDWGDKFWGKSPVGGAGQNHLGIILMRLRNHLRLIAAPA